MKNRFRKHSIFASLVLVMCGPAAHGTTYYWDLNGTTANTAVAVTGAWNGTNAFWSTASTGSGVAGVASTTANDDLVFSSGNVYTTGTVTASNSRVASSISFEDNIVVTLAGPVTIGGGGAKSGVFVLTGDNSANTVSGALSLAAASTIQNDGTGVLSLTGGITGTQNLVLKNNGATASGITISSTSLNNTGTVTNNGTGAGSTLISAVIGTSVTNVTQNSTTSGLTLSGANTFGGTVNVTSGTLTVSNASGISSASGVTISSGASLAFAGVSQTMASGKTLSIAGSGVGGAGALQTTGAAATIAWNGAISLAGNSTIHPNGNGAFTTASTGTIALGAFNLTMSLDGSNTSTLAGAISGTGSLTKASTATLGLTAANTFSGGLNILLGTVLTSGNAGALGTGTVLLGDTSGSGNATLNTGATALTFANDINVRSGSSGVKTLGHTGTASVTYSGGVALNGNLTINNTNTGRLTFTGIMSGTGALTVTGSSTGDYVPSGLNTYSGTTTLNPGSFTAVGANSAGPAGAPTSGCFGTGTLNLSGGQLRAGIVAASTIGNPVSLLADSTFYTIASEKNLLFSGPVTLTGATRTLTSTVGTTVAGTSVIFNGNIGEASAGLGLIKAGAGNITFNGTNSYTGNTDITAGNLSIGSIAALPGYNTSGRFSVSPGATLTVQNGVSDADITSLLGTGNFQASSNLGIDTSLGDRTLPLNLSGSINLIKSGANTLTLSGTNTYTGNLSVTGGSLNITSSAAIPAFPSGLAIASGTTLVVPNAVTESEVTSLLGTTSLAAGANLAFDTTAGDRIFSNPVTNSAAGSINLIKLGSNTLTLNGANTYTGSTTISKGTLVAGGSSTAAGNLVIGNTTDNAVLNIPSGGSMAGAIFTVGSISGSSAAMNITGGTLTMAASSDNDSSSFGCVDGSYGAFTISSGTYNQQRFMFGGTGSVGGTGVGLVTGGTVNATGWLILSRASTGSGTLTVTGGTINHANAINNLVVGLSGSGRAELNVTGGLVDNTGKTLNMGGSGTFHWTGTGLLNLNGGTVLTNSVLYDANAAAVTSNSYVNFSGGTLKAALASTTLLPAFTSAGSGINQVLINGAFGSFTGGAVIDTNGFDSTVSANLLAPTGSGVTALSIDDAGSGYIGAPAVRILDNGLPSTATAYAVVGTDPTNLATFGKLTSVVITNPGVITGTPTVSLVGGGGTGAAVSVASTGGNTSGGLTKTGAGTLFLTGANTYTGATTVSAGTLTTSGTGTLSGTSGLSVASGARFSHSPSSPGTLTLGTSSTLTLASGSTLGISFDSPIAAPGAASVSGTVNLSLSGAFTSGNTYTVLSAAGGGLTGGTFNILNPVDFTFTKVVTSTTVEITPTAATALGSAYWRGGLSGSAKVWAASDGSAGSNWTTDGAGTATPLVPGSTAGVIFSDVGATAASQLGMSLGASMSINGFSTSSGDPISLLSPDAAALTIGSGGITLLPGAGSVTLDPNITLSSPQSWNNNSTSLLTLNGTVSNGTNLLTFNGSGTTTLGNLLGGSGGLSFTAGSNTVASAALTANQTWTNSSGSLLSIGNVTNNAFTLTLAGASDTTFTGIYSGNGGLTRTGAGTLFLNGGHTYKGVTTIGTGSATAGTTGRLVMSGNNSGATGNVNIGNGSTLQLQSANALGTTGVSGSQLGLFNGSTLQLRSDAGTTFSGTNTLAGLNSATVAIDVGPLNTASGNTLTISPGTSPMGNAVTFNITGGSSYGLAMGTFQSVTGGSTNLTLNPTTANVSLVGYSNQNNGANSSTLTLSGTSSDNRITGVVANQGTGSTGTGNVAVTKSGTSTWTLSGANTFTGNINVTGGTLNLTGARTATSGQFSVGAGGSATLNISNGSFTTGQFAVGIGTDTSSVGVVNHTAGTLTMSGNQLLIGNGGTNAPAGTTSYGTYNLKGTGTLNTVTSSLGVVIGVNSGTTATFNLSENGVLSMPVGSTLQITRSDNTTNCQNNTGSFIQTGGTATVGILQMGGSSTTPANNAGQNATLSITAGTFSASSFTQLSGGDNSTSAITIGGTALVTLPAFPAARGASSTVNLIFDGGTLLPTAASAAYMPAVAGTLARITSNGARFDVGTGKDITVAQVLQDAVSNTGTLTKAGAGVLSLSGANTYTGTTTINAGTLQLGSATTTGSLDPASTIVNNGTFAVNRTNAVVQGTDFSTAAITGTGGFTQAGTGTTTLNAANSFTGPTTITAGTLATATIGQIGVAGPLGSGDATNAATNTASLVLSGGTLGYTSATGTTNRGFTVSANSSFSFPAGNNNAFTFSGAIAGSGGLTLTGQSTVGLQNVLTLSGNNSSLTGNVNASIGGIRVTNNNSLGSGTKTISANNGSAGNSNIQLDGSGGDITLPSTFTYAVSNQTNNGSLINLAGNNTVQGAFNITTGGGGFMVSSVGGNLNISATITAAATSRDVYLGGASTGTVSGVISNGLTSTGLKVQKFGTGTWTLTGANTFSGSTIAGEGTLSAGSLNSVVGGTASSNLGAPTTVANGVISLGGGGIVNPAPAATGTLSYTGAGETTDRVINLNGGSGGGILAQNGTGLLKFTSNLTTVFLGSKTFALSGSSAGTGEFSGVIPDGVSGTTSLVSTFAIGATTVTLGSVDGVSVGASISGTGLAVGTTITAINTATRTVTLSTPATAISGTIGSAYTVAGVINYTAFNKAGTGTWVLSGANTYSGGSSVNAGTLTLGNGSALGTGPATVTGGSLDLGGQTIPNVVSIGTGGTLTGSGITGAATLAGTVTPGGSGSGLITMASASVASTSSIALQIAGVGTRGVNYDALTVSGPLVLDGTLTVSLNGLTPAAGQSFDLIDSTGAIDLTAFTVATDLILPALSGGLSWDTSAFASTGTISIVNGDAYSSWAASKGLNDSDAAHSSAKNADPDNDGHNNLYEFAFDGNPLAGATDGKIVGKIGTVGGNPVWTLTLPVRTGATFSANGGDQLSALIDGLYYRIEGDADLATFANTITEVTGGEATTIQSGLPTLSTGWTYRTFRNSGTVPTVPKSFLRAKISETP